MTDPLRALHAEPDPVDGGRIVDDLGREVLLRGVNVNSYVDYWSGNDFPTAFPFTERDIDAIAELGWNVVRLLFSWSLVEPEPGEYDDAYLDRLSGVVRALERRGIYTLLDAHQDAWGATLAARPGEECPDSAVPANGWNGAPGWATLVDDDVRRCAEGGIRELSPAVLAAFEAFFADAEGPDGVGVRTRFARMWGYVAERFAHDPAIAGYDLLNEPNAFSPAQLDGLVAMYRDATNEIRAAEQRMGGLSHMVVFEPSALWSEFGQGAPPAWDHDSNVVYSPHVYQGAFTGDPLTRDPFIVAVEEAKRFGGAPILIGEWGTATENHYGTQRVGPDGDGYFIDHQGWQDEFHMSATIWELTESYGDPHKVKPGVDMTTVPVAGLVDVDSATNEVVGQRTALLHDLLRPYAVAAPGELVRTYYDERLGTVEVVATEAPVGVVAHIFYPATKHGRPDVEIDGLDGLATTSTAQGNVHLTGVTTAPNWRLVARPRGRSH